LKRPYVYKTETTLETPFSVNEISKIILIDQNFNLRSYNISDLFSIMNTTQNNSISECTGCLLNNKCLPFGVRIDGQYCDISGNLNAQKVNEGAYNNNYECLTNTCTSGRCIDLAGEIKETRGMLARVIEWLKKLFCRQPVRVNQCSWYKPYLFGCFTV